MNHQFKFAKLKFGCILLFLSCFSWTKVGLWGHWKYLCRCHGLVQYVHNFCDVLYASCTCQMVYGLQSIYIIHPYYHFSFWNPSKTQSSSSSVEHLVYWVLISWFVAILFILYYHQFWLIMKLSRCELDRTVYKISDWKSSEESFFGNQTLLWCLA